MHNELEGLKKLHTSLARGYMFRKEKDGRIEPYKGKFGEGFKLHEPYYKSNNYHQVSYFVK